MLPNSNVYLLQRTGNVAQLQCISLTEDRECCPTPMCISYRGQGILSNSCISLTEDREYCLTSVYLLQRTGNIA